MIGTPRFWYARRPPPRALVAVLGPLAWIYRAADQRRRSRIVGEDPGIPVVCIGNLTLGGSGKTPVARAVLSRFRALGAEAHGLSRGYGGAERGPWRVDPRTDGVARVGDEALMLAADAPMWVAGDRRAGARAARAAGAEVIVLDDGHQNPALVKHLSIVVIDGETRNGEWPFGHGDLFPLGPLREPLVEGLGRADAVVVMLPADLDRPDPDLLALLGELPVLTARLLASAPLPSGPVLGFAGVAKPWRIERSLRSQGCALADFVPFPDHHAYRPSDLKFLEERARDLGAQLLTTEKDWVRLPPEVRLRTAVARVAARFDDAPALDRLLAPIVPGGAAGGRGRSSPP